MQSYEMAQPISANYEREEEEKTNIPEDNPIFEPLRKLRELLHVPTSATPTSGNELPLTKIKLVTFDKKNCMEISEKDLPECKSHVRMTRVKKEKPKERSLLLVQNITIEWVWLLHVRWGVSLEFFLSHLEHSDWYNMNNVQQVLPALRSVQWQRKTDICFPFIATREIEIKTSSGNQNAGQSSVLQTKFLYER